MAAQTYTVKLTRFEPMAWGFRLQGGKDFGTPLAIQRIQPESIADKAGLRPGDCILKINDVNADLLRHKEAQDTIVRAGNSFEIVLQRGGMSTWKPSVSSIESLKSISKQSMSNYSGDITPVTKTSLAANKQDFQPAGSTHNVRAKPFGGASEVNGTDTVTALVHKQYNSPAAMYSMHNIAETLSSQAEVLATGAKGINFMKPDPAINKESAVYKMVKEEETLPPPPHHVTENYASEEPAYKTGSPTPTTFRPPGLRSVEAPKMAPSASSDGPKLTGGENVCFDCGRLIVGVFVRIKDKSLHADCFKCNTCGGNLKNVGYYNINDKLYCDIHARQVARQNPPAGNLTPVTVPGGAPFPTNVSIIPTAKPSSPLPRGGAGSPGAYGPMPFHGGAKPASPYGRPTTGPTSGVHKSMSGTATFPRKGGARFVWPPPKQPDEVSDAMLETAPTPSVPAPCYRAPPSTQHTQFTSSVFKQSTIETSQTSHSSQMSAPAPPMSPIPKCASPTTFAPVPYNPSAVPVYKPVAPPTPISTPTATPAAPAWAPAAPAPAAPAPAPFEPTISPITGPPSGGPTGGPKSGGTAGMTRPAPKRGRGVLKTSVAPGTRIPICAVCGTPIRGPFVTALGKTWCPDHFLCVNSNCHRALQDVGFVEEQGQLYCETCYETYLAPICNKCNGRIKGDCLNAIGKQWHPECFMCAYCHTPFGNDHFYLEDGLPYCEKDWNELFTTKCVACGFAIEAGDRWVEALNSNFHSQCFKCTICHKNLEGQSFYAKGGRPFCKSHAR